MVAREPPKVHIPQLVEPGTTHQPLLELPSRLYACVSEALEIINEVNCLLLKKVFLLGNSSTSSRVRYFKFLTFQILCNY